MMHSWVVRGAQRFELPGAQIGREHLAGRMVWDARLKRWLEEFLNLIFEEGSGGRVVPHAHASDAIRYARRDGAPS